ncbi:MAG: ABC transporter, permease protein 1 (cluster 1, maltose/g3p/polyamine/iron) [uncultured Thermomicrobiales bacterium]|uniref:ABC transporter, permease protein 1 (Cluster 1, maltose/g3p/polyamine/iron) n=1 Tax=uncultured Thermomicrobiales bacterium TaxID=1645740 RepID=A0A6J4V0K7_9BACT|nr:MAG: ABC transporter, permease protein 1 (cluster 1, maltose/g3p/polyamine/iron) [uncultured Thermomicrobiales bacterium]
MATTTLPARAARRSAAARRRDRSATFAFWVLMSPMVVGLLLFTVIPIVWGLLLSFTDARSQITVGDWIGFENYQWVLGQQEFLRSLRTILVFTVFIVPLTFAVSLGLALLVDRAGWGRGIFRTAFFIPTAISYVVASLVWKLGLFNSLPYGVANLGLSNFGIDPIVWIGPGDIPWYWVVLVTVRLWLQVGFYMIIFIAGLQEIPKDLYESAFVDGGRPGWTTFRTITLPLLRNTSIAVIVLSLINAFQAFDEFYNVLGGGSFASGGNLSLARPPLVWLYQTAFGGQEYGRGSAGAFILTALIIAVTLIQGRVLGFGRSSAEK